MTESIRQLGFRRLLSVAVFCLTSLSLVSCSGSGGNVEGFCRRWYDTLDQVTSGSINSTEQLLDAISVSNLGDPGGELSEYRRAFEAAVRNGTNEDAALYTDLINSFCAELPG